MNNLSAKRVFDLTIVLAAAPGWLPLMAAVAVVVGWKLGRPVFFRQKRPGLHETIFEIIKFRTMQQDPRGQLTDAERLSTFGRWLRSTSLDELPELLNVIRGEMSLVGPRPLLVQYLSRYNSEQRRRHEVMPGLTGWAQVRGRNTLSWEQKFALDVWYVEHHNLWLDVRILVQTLFQVIMRRGISAPGAATMPEFYADESPKMTAPRQELFRNTPVANSEPGNDPNA